MNSSALRVSDVFVPGGMPTVTYVARESNAEETVVDYLAERHKILSVSGPSKSGKTVLLRSLIEEGIWLSGSDIHSLDDFWAGVADALDLYPEEQQTRGRRESTSVAKEVKGSAKPFGIGLEAGRNSADESATEHGRSRARTRPLRALCKEELERSRPVIVFDDFHYIDRGVQRGISRALKDLIFKGVGAVVVAVPHRADDPIRVEKEMTGRVEHLQVRFWNEAELLNIARQGFRALNAEAEPGVAERLARESFQSPFLMQDFCLQLCKLSEIRESEPATARLSDARDWHLFFQKRASAMSRDAFDLLARGPRLRDDMRECVLSNGSVTDIYTAALHAIACTGPLPRITDDRLRKAFRLVLIDEPPERDEVAQVLEEMSHIAREEIEGEPLVDYDSDLGVLHIADPFFSFFLRWGPAARWGEEQISQAFSPTVPPRLPPA